MYQQVTYPIQSLQLQQLIDKKQIANCNINVEEQLYHFTVRASKQFAVGSQTRTEQSYKVDTTHEAWIPKTAVDWVKRLIADFIPALNFGWLKPQYRQITKQQKITNNITYYNIYPVSEQWDMVTYLESQPYTVSEWNSAVAKVMPSTKPTPITRYSGKELADYMAEYIYNKQ